MSIDIAERYGDDFRRRLFSAERLSDAATARGLAFVEDGAFQIERVAALRDRA